MKDEKILVDILEARESRRDKQIELIDKYNKSLVSFTLNIPGKIKDSPSYREIHREGMISIINSLENMGIEIIYKEEISKKTGSEGFIVIDMEAIDLKNIMVHIEETHPMGRIFDIDVFDSFHNQMSRRDMDTRPRRCLLCNNDARVCMRMKSHRYEELINEINRMWKSYNEAKD